MAGPRFLAESFFNIQQFPGHTITAEEETTGFEAWRVGAARRVGGRIRAYWTPTTANSTSWVECKCDRARAADMLVIDRGHNLDGETVNLEASDDNFATTTEVFSVVLPSNVVSNSRLSDTPGVKTTEGAYVISFDYHVALYWRIFVAAMGAGLKPQIPGAYLGKSFSPTNRPPRAWDDEPTQIVYQQIVSDSLWTSSSRKAKRRGASVTMKMASDLEQNQARYHFRSLYHGGGDVMWNVPDTDNAERAWLAEAPPGRDSQAYPANYPRRIVSVSMVEHNPKSGV